MRMPDPMPLGLTFLLAIASATVWASLVKRSLGGKVETVFTRCDQRLTVSFVFAMATLPAVVFPSAAIRRTFVLRRLRLLVRFVLALKLRLRLPVLLTLDRGLTFVCTLVFDAAAGARVLLSLWATHLRPPFGRLSFWRRMPLARIFTTFFPWQRGFTGPSPLGRWGRSLFTPTDFRPRGGSLNAMIELSCVGEETPIADSVPAVNGQVRGPAQRVDAQVEREEVPPLRSVEANLERVKGHNDVASRPAGNLRSDGEKDRCAASLLVDHEIFNRAQSLMVRSPNGHADEVAAMNELGLGVARRLNCRHRGRGRKSRRGDLRRGRNRLGRGRHVSMSE